jgi:type 2 lantibiotic biosynthesis protein LanM
MYQFFIKHRQVLLSVNSPIAQLADQSVRFVCRHTKTYTSILQRTLNPKFLRDGADRSIQIDILSHAMLDSETKPFCWPLLQIEQQALEQMDVPLFTTSADSENLTLAPHKTIPQFFREPSINAVMTRLSQLSDDDLKQQISFIEGALYSRTIDDAHLLVSPNYAAFQLNSFSPLAHQQIIEQALIIAAELQKKAVCSKDGSAIWFAPQYIPEAQRFQFKPMAYRLYDGSLGVSLFLAALEKVTTGAGYRDLALGALQSLRQDLQEPTFAGSLQAMGIGGALGLGSIIYALVRVSQLLEEPVLLTDAKQVACLIIPELIAADKEFDIVSGAAGAILGLLALYHNSDDSDVLARAVATGEHLLNNRTRSNLGYRAWATFEGKLLTGFSHGAAGIA